MIKFVGFGIKFSILSVLILTTSISGQQKCPDVLPMEDFDIDQFLGTWYVIQKTKTESRCIQHQITPLENEREYRISQVSPHHILDKFPLKHEHTYAGFLVTDATSPARMKVRYALSFGEEAYIVVTTDYETYAGIIECAGAAKTATILSRTQNLSEFQIDEIRAKLEAFGIKINDLSTISHKNCPRDGVRGLNIKIGHDLLSPDRISKAATGMVRDLGQAIEGAFQNGANFLNGLFGGNKKN
uniref:Putative apolipoprotein d/lipocalin lipocalin lipocalin n=1 Tax=Lutzomyia longipalpis TaxID=7200 RepID=A0A1B0CL21_LUTLO